MVQIEISVFEDRSSTGSSSSGSSASGCSARWLEEQHQEYGYHGAKGIAKIRMLKHESTRFWIKRMSKPLIPSSSLFAIT